MLYTFLICCSIKASLESFGYCGYYYFLDLICSSSLSFCCAILSCSWRRQGFSQYSWGQGCFFLFQPRQHAHGRDIRPTKENKWLGISNLTWHFCIASVFFVYGSNLLKPFDFMVQRLNLLHENAFVNSLKDKLEALFPIITYSIDSDPFQMTGQLNSFEIWVFERLGEFERFFLSSTASTKVIDFSLAF